MAISEICTRVLLSTINQPTLNKMILNCFKSITCILFGIITLHCAPALANKVQFGQLCPLISGQWQGSAANPNGLSKQVTTSVLCSADNNNMYISISQGARFSNSETWWFRVRGNEIELIYSDGINADISQLFTLYQQGDGFTFLGKGEIKQRPALIRLSFDAQQANGKTHWLWQQSAHFLDDDSDSYQVVRGVSLMPIGR
jgi:hypothetical protein